MTVYTECPSCTGENHTEDECFCDCHDPRSLDERITDMVYEDLHDIPVRTILRCEAR